jgi:large subunit ribosomal protein L13
MNKTIFYTKQEEDYKWFLIDADSETLGRLSTKISNILTGKIDPLYSPGQQIKNAVIVVNAEKISVTGKKPTEKFYRRHSGRPGGMTIETFKEVQVRLPARIIEKAVKGMLPKGPLGRYLFTKLKVYKGTAHPHGAQNPKQLHIK